MPASLETLWTFTTNADAHATFLHRVAAAIVEWAVVERESDTPSLVTPLWVARQEWVVWALKNPLAAATQILPSLAIKANAAALISDAGIITASDAQIRSVINDALIDLYAGYVPPAA
jgi:hypothetical protein